MRLFDLDYGEMLRPAFKILISRGWGQCTNETGEPLLVYGPKHLRDRSIFDNSPYVLPPGSTTPDRWDCDGVFVPSDRMLKRWRHSQAGPLAVKFWDYRRFTVRRSGDVYSARWHNGVFEPSQVNWAIPNLSLAEIHQRLQVETHEPERAPGRQRNS
jgi:hypothetical protein